LEYLFDPSDGFVSYTHIRLFICSSGSVLIHAVATVCTIGHQTYLVFMGVIVLHRGMLPGIISPVDHKCVTSSFMFFNVLVLVLAEQ
jgi:hypothetical protein